MQDNNPLLSVDNLKVYFFTQAKGVVRAVDGVGFSLRQGESLGIVGESGSGKSVTALSLMRLQPHPGRIVEGSVLFQGQDLLRKSQGELRKLRGKHISLILQDPNTSLNPVFSVGSQVAEGIRLHQSLGGKALWQKVLDSLRLVRIPSPELRANDYPHQMSGGMRQRVAGAIGFANHPSLLIADEPTTALDVTIQRQYLRLLKEIQRSSQMSLIFITHDLGVVARMCGQVVVMYGGRIVESGATRELFKRPSHPYTTALLRCIPRLHRVERLVQIEGQPPDPAYFPPGCRFSPRCPKVQDLCRREYPEEREVGPGHRVSCWFPEQ